MAKEKNKTTKIITLCPVRINFSAGWSDQLEWKYPSAVVNASVGWRVNPKDDPYPLIFFENTFRSKIAGKGTGLGISSILASAQYIHQNYSSLDKNKYIKVALEWENKQGTKGGWQDQIGAIEGGFKLITSENHKTFDIRHRNDHPIMNHLILFDSGIRRPAKHIGDQIRMLFKDKNFTLAMKKNVEIAKLTFDSNAKEFALATLDCWKRLTSFVPDMKVNNLPYLPNCWGKMFVGAGGGGWGLYFAENPSDRPELIKLLNDRGFDAYIPELLDGIKNIKLTPRK